MSAPQQDVPPSEILRKVAEALPQGSLNSTDTPVLPAKEDIHEALTQTPMTFLTDGISLDETLSQLVLNITNGLNLSSLSPRYYGFVTGGVTPAALAADFLTSIYDQNVQVHLPEETIATNIESRALDMLLDLLHFEESTFPTKTFTTGATGSNVLGLALGREWLIKTYAEKNGISPVPSVGDLGLLSACALAKISRIEVVSTMPHSSIAKAAGIIGLGRSSIVDLFDPRDPVTLDLQSVKEYIEKRQPSTATILALSVGEVNTGLFAFSSLEAMQELRALCTAHNIWLHVDGAFGLFARLLLPPPDRDPSSTELDQHQANSTIASGTYGLDLADSITGDGHKFLNVPYDCGFFFSRHPPSLSEAVFQNGNAAYLAPAVLKPGEEYIPSPLNIRIENSSRFRGLPVYASLLSLGRNGYTKMLRRHIDLARKITSYLLHHPDYIVLPHHSDTRSEAQILDSTFIIVLLRAKDDTINNALVQKIKDTRKMYVSGTVWQGEKAARIAISNWRCDVERDFEIVRRVLDEVIR